MEAVGATIRARDGRGPRTELERLIPAHFGVRHPYQVMEAIHVGEIEHAAPDRAGAGRAAQPPTPVTQSPRRWSSRLADELVTMVRAAVRRLRLTRRELDVVLGGGIVRSDCKLFHERRAGRAFASPRSTCPRDHHG